METSNSLKYSKQQLVLSDAAPKSSSKRRRKRKKRANFLPCQLSNCKKKKFESIKLKNINAIFWFQIKLEINQIINCKYGGAI